ncbi:sucrase [bacterium]|nr:sucrase [bacterium]
MRIAKGGDGNLEFSKLVQPVRRESVFKMDGWIIWGASMARTDDGVCHLLVARWPKDKGHNAWVTHSDIIHATADNPLGPYTFQGVALGGSGGDNWDADVTHNPTVLRVGDKYYLYYMGTKGPGEYWDHRNRQRIGVAVADHPGGPWKRFDKPVLDVTPGAWDSLMTSNPTCCQGPDGRFYMLYKGVGDGPMPKGGAVLCGVAIADNPLGPFKKHPDPIIRNPENPWAVEDAFTWCQDERFYCIIKDFQGYFAGTEKNVLVLFESFDGIDWKPSHHTLAMRRELRWEDGEVQPVHRLERPQVYLEDGKPTVIFLAVAPDEKAIDTFNVHVPLSSE